MTRQLCFDTYVHIMHSYVVHRCAAISSVLYDGSHCMTCGLEHMLSVFCASYLGKVLSGTLCIVPVKGYMSLNINVYYYIMYST